MRTLIFPLLFVLLTTGTAVCQDLVPRRWSHLPIDSNFVGMRYGYTSADIAFDPVLKLEGVEMDMHTVGFGYIRTFELLEKSARVELKLPFQDAYWEGLVDGKPASTHRRGMADPVVRLAVNLLGSPPLKGKEFAKYRASVKQETILGTGVVVHVPLGQYYEDKLLNLGSNRFTIRPQLGLLHQQGNWTAEVTGSVWFFTDNNSFFGGHQYEQDPEFTIQAHLIYTFHPVLWASISGGFGYGAESTIDDVPKENEQRNVAWSLGLGYTLTHQLGLTFKYVGIDNRSDTGADFHTFMTGITYFW